MKKMFLTMTLMLACVTQLAAQSAKIADSDIVGVWTMESMQWEGEKKVLCGKASGYAQFKYYGADGEYACAEIALTKDGKCVVIPHEYGTYTFKDGWYSEMDRPAIKDAITWIDKTTTKGTWMKRHDIWKKQTTIPEKLTRYIVECCKMKNTPEEMEKLMKQNFFK